MVSLAFHLFVVGTVIFVLRSYDCSRPLLCCDLVVCFFFLSFFHLMLAGRQPFWVLRWFQLFCFFHLVSAIFCLSQAFVVWSFFLCHRHLWSVLSFFATGICVQSPSFTAFLP